MTGHSLARLRSGEVCAMAPSCPHEAARLVDGTLRGNALDCPRHHYLFDPRIGRNLYPRPVYPRWKQEEVVCLNLRTFPCREESGWILVEPNPNPPRARGREEVRNEIRWDPRLIARTSRISKP